MSSKSKTSRAKSTAVLSAMVLLGIFAAVNAKYSGGTGEPNDPYRIATAEDLNDIGNHQEDWDKHFILINDVNLAQYTGTQFKIIGNSTRMFTGVFDGNDHKIWNFTWFSQGIDDIGLFRYVGSGGQIRNLDLENVDVNAANGEITGSLVGENYRGTIANCYSAGTVWGYQIVGGLVGANYSGTIRSCHSTGSVTGDVVVAGLLGINDSGTIIWCYSSCTVSGRQRVAGLVAYMWRACAVINCYATGNITGENCVGGLIAYNDEYSTIINNCYSTGNVGGNVYVGGLIGTNRWDNTITSCNSTSDVRGQNCVGGLIGESESSTISGCFSTGSVDGNELVGGLVGNNRYGLMTSCYSRSDVKGNNCVGGLIGHLLGYSDEEVVVLRDCYSTGNVSGETQVGGMVGYDYSGKIMASFWDIQTSDCNTSSGGTGKTTAEMKTMSTFTDTGWDFVEIWGIGENQTYPYLRFAPAGDLNYDKKVDLIDLAILASHWLEEK